MSRAVRVVVTIALIIGLAAGFLYQRLTTFGSERVTDDVQVIYGHSGPFMASSNVAVLRTAAGPVVVDTMTFPFHGRMIQRRAAELVQGPVQAVFNTHYHQDHTHGNPAFAPGTRIVASERTREHLLARDADYWKGAAAALLPNETAAHGHEMRIGGKTVRSSYLGRGHTDGDLVVVFVEDRVLVTGDLVWNGHYPNIDLEAGGTIREWQATLDEVLKLDFDRVVPGHGAVTDREGIRAFQRFLAELWTQSEAAARAGKSLEATLASVRLTQDDGWEPIAIPFVLNLDRDFVVTRGWQEATGAVKVTPR